MSNLTILNHEINNEDVQSLTGKDLRRIYLGDCADVTLWRLRKNDETFPQPFTISGTLLWSKADVQRWYDGKRAEQSEQAA